MSYYQIFILSLPNDTRNHPVHSWYYRAIFSPTSPIRDASLIAVGPFVAVTRLGFWQLGPGTYSRVGTFACTSGLMIFQLLLLVLQDIWKKEKLQKRKKKKRGYHFCSPVAPGSYKPGTKGGGVLICVTRWRRGVNRKYHFSYIIWEK